MGERHRANRLFGVPLPLHSCIRSAHSGTAAPPLQSGADVIFRTQLPLRIGRFWSAILCMGGRTYLGIVHCIMLSMPDSWKMSYASFAFRQNSCRRKCNYVIQTIDSNRLHENLGRRQKHKRLKIKFHRLPV